MTTPIDSNTPSHTQQDRRHFRVNHQAGVRLNSKQESITCQTRDLSESGVYVMGNFSHPVLIGDELEITVLILEDAEPRKVVVRRIDHNEGLALEFSL